MIKMLIVSMISIDKLHPRTFIFNKIIENIEKNDSVLVNWIICKPEKFLKIEKSNKIIHDIHFFNNGYDILIKTKPDVILADGDNEPIQFAITNAANHLKIPVIARPPYLEYIPTKTLRNSRISKLRIFFSNQSLSENTKPKLLGRANFIIYKILFLFKTDLKIKKNFFRSLIFIIVYSFRLFLSKEPNLLNSNMDLYLISSIKQEEIYQKYGIQKSKLSLVGNIWLDRLFSLIDNSNSNLKINKNFKVLLITSPLYEHGFWTYPQRDLFLSKLFLILKNKNNISISLKIHPVSEKLNYFKNLLNQLKLDIPIFQSEDLLDLVPNYDLCITFGASQALGDIAFLQKRILCIPLGQSFQNRALVNEAIISGYVKICYTLDHLLENLNQLISSNPQPCSEYILKRNELFYNFDGKSAERSASKIISFLKNYS